MIELNVIQISIYTDFDLSKYYSLDNGVSYFLCRNTLQNCEECLNDKICTKCLPDYFFKDYDKSRCYLEDDLYNNKSYYKYNDTTYMKCSNLISNCELCSNDKECDVCRCLY